MPRTDETDNTHYSFRFKCLAAIAGVIAATAVAVGIALAALATKSATVAGAAFASHTFAATAGTAAVVTSSVLPPLALGIIVCVSALLLAFAIYECCRPRNTHAHREPVSYAISPVGPAYPLEPSAGMFYLDGDRFFGSRRTHFSSRHGHRSNPVPAGATMVDRPVRAPAVELSHEHGHDEGQTRRRHGHGHG